VAQAGAVRAAHLIGFLRRAQLHAGSIGLPAGTSELVFCVSLDLSDTGKNRRLLLTVQIIT
jgi:hypothetical protein